MQFPPPHHHPCIPWGLQWPIYVAKTKNFITLAGCCPETTLLTWNNTASHIDHHQTPRVIGVGTFGCGSVIVEGEDFIAENITFENSAPKMIEGCPPFSTKPENEVPKVYAAKQWPPFRAPQKLYSHGIKELIEDCWNEKPSKRPTFRQIIDRLSVIYNHLVHKSRWKVRPLMCFQSLEAMFKKDHSDPSSRDGSSSRSI